jgi:penicillin-binding protein A
MKIKILIALILLSAGPLFYSVNDYIEQERIEELVKVKNYVRSSVSQQLTNESIFPESLVYGDQKIEVDYTVNEKFQEKIEKILKRYPSDYSSIVVVDNETGDLLAFAGVDRNSREVNYRLPFTSTHPSASLFKIVTTADLLENTNLDPTTKFSYRGRGTTLYKYQLKNKISRWTRWISFKKAFAYSNNVIFGKAAINKTNGQSIFKTAFKFGFNRDLMADFNLGPSQFLMPESQYQLAELASGFNKKTVISPVHAATMVSIIANDGLFINPKLLKNVKMGDDEFRYENIKQQILAKETSNDIAKMMEYTTQTGTARALTRGRIGRYLNKHFVLGAKTGSITGGIPYGKRDWLAFYAKPKEESEFKEIGSKGISVSIMNVNGKKWYYKSSFIAKRVLKAYLETLEEELVNNSDKIVSKGS